MADYFLWAPLAERYRGPSGRFVSRAAVRATLDIVLDRQMGRVRALSEGLVSGDVALPEWRMRMAESLKIAHLEGSAVARGGWQQLTQQDLDWTSQRIRSQLWYLQRFHDDIASGVIPLNGPSIASRAEMYVEMGRASQRLMEQRMARSRGADMEKNVLGSERPCAQCVAASAAGWVRIGALPPIGSRTCLSRDHCHLNFRKTI